MRPAAGAWQGGVAITADTEQVPDKWLTRDQVAALLQTTPKQLMRSTLGRALPWNTSLGRASGYWRVCEATLFEVLRAGEGAREQRRVARRGRERPYGIGLDVGEARRTGGR